MSKEITAQSFPEEVEQADLPVLIDFYADWCMPCKLIAPVLEEIEKESPGIKVCKVNVDQEPELAQQFRIMSIPTLMFLKEGQTIATRVGVLPKESILEMLREQ